MVQKRASSVDALSDAELYRLIADASSDDTRLVGHDPAFDKLRRAPVWRITPDAVAKAVRGPSEAYTMQYVQAHTSIPVPTVRRILPKQHSYDPTLECYWIVMDYIPGNTLLDVWTSLPDERKHDIIHKLSCYIRELQDCPLPNPPIPGPLHPDGKPVLCTNSFFSEVGAGPFNSYQEMAAWFDHQRLCCMIMWHQRCRGWMLQCPKFDTSHPFVLCHMDLHPRNILLDADGTLWLIDWGIAGVFPKPFEYAGIALAVVADYALRNVPAWRDLAANAVAIAGDYAAYYKDFLLVLFDYSTGINFAVSDDKKYLPDDYFEARGIVVD